VIGGACDRVRQRVEEAMAEGVLDLPPNLAAHVERCPHCSAEVREVEMLLHRLRSLPASLDLTPVPAAVDRVLQAAASNLAAAGSAPSPEERRRRRMPQWQWVLGQVAAVAAVIAIAAGGLTLLGLRIHGAVSGQPPGQIVERWVAPLRDWTQALFRNVR
jgi:anti-sigma factor RsiW